MDESHDLIFLIDPRRKSVQGLEDYSPQRVLKRVGDTIDNDGAWNEIICSRSA